MAMQEAVLVATAKHETRAQIQAYLAEQDGDMRPRGAAAGAAVDAHMGVEEVQGPGVDVEMHVGAGGAPGQADDAEMPALQSATALQSVAVLLGHYDAVAAMQNVGGEAIVGVVRQFCDAVAPEARLREPRDMLRMLAEFVERIINPTRAFGTASELLRVAGAFAGEADVAEFMPGLLFVATQSLLRLGVNSFRHSRDAVRILRKLARMDDGVPWPTVCEWLPVEVQEVQQVVGNARDVVRENAAAHWDVPEE